MIAFHLLSNRVFVKGHFINRKYLSTVPTLSNGPSFLDGFWSLMHSTTEIAPAYLDALRETFHLPWYMNVSILAISIRLITFPLHVRGQRYSAALAKIQPELTALNAKFKDASASGDSATGNLAIDEMRRLYRTHGTSPTRQIACTFFPVPIFVATFMGLKRMAAEKLPATLTEGGALWFMDLTVPDPYFILPFLSSMTILASMELGRLGKDHAFMPISKGQMTLMRFLAFVGFPFIIGMPAILSYYFVSSNILTCIQTLLLMHRGLRKSLHLPDISPNARLYHFIGSQTPTERFYEQNVTYKPSEPPMPFGFNNNRRSVISKLIERFILAREQGKNNAIQLSGLRRIKVWLEKDDRTKQKDETNLSNRLHG